MAKAKILEQAWDATTATAGASILSAWRDCKAAYSAPPSSQAEEARKFAVIDQAEVTIANSVGRTPAEWEAQIWVALRHLIEVTPAVDSALDCCDLEELERHKSELDFAPQILVSVMRGLRALSSTASCSPAQKAEIDKLVNSLHDRLAEAQHLASVLDDAADEFNDALPRDPANAARFYDTAERALVLSRLAKSTIRSAQGIANEIEAANYRRPK